MLVLSPAMKRRTFMLTAAGVALCVAPGVARAGKQSAPSPILIRGPLVHGARAETLLFAGASLILGRGEGSDVLVQVVDREGKRLQASDRVSRKHAEITLSSKGARVRDLGSSNGSVLGGKALSTKAKALAAGSILELAGVIAFEISVVPGSYVALRPKPMGKATSATAGPTLVLVSGTIGLSPSAPGFVCNKADGVASASMSAGDLRIDMKSNTVMSGGTTMFGQSGSGKLQFSDVALDIGSLDKGDVLGHLFEPAEQAHTFCGTPEY